jgi:hypothetical protein
MALASTIKEGATTVAASGGTDTVLSSLGIQGNKNTLIFSTDTANLTRRLLEASVKPYAVDDSKPGGFTQQRSKTVLKQPKVLANGKRTLNTATYELSVDPETTAAEIEQMQETMGQIVGSAAFLALYTTQNLN